MKTLKNMHTSLISKNLHFDVCGGCGAEAGEQESRQRHTHRHTYTNTLMWLASARTVFVHLSNYWFNKYWLSNRYVLGTGSGAKNIIEIDKNPCPHWDLVFVEETDLNNKLGIFRSMNEIKQGDKMRLKGKTYFSYTQKSKEQETAWPVWKPKVFLHGRTTVLYVLPHSTYWCGKENSKKRIQRKE